jgi:beta-glucosidase
MEPTRDEPNDAIAFGDAAARVAAGADARAEARALLGRMTTPEKLSCLDGDTPFWDGLVDMIAGGYYEHTYPAAAVPRLGVPGIAFSDGPRGVVVGQATAFPVSMARGATFDPALEERIGDAIGRELRAVGANFYGGVCVNLLRHPGWGRAQETYGEDPFHVGEMGAALARGAQRHVLACVKHFACNSIENARFKVDVRADERALHEVYLPHFRRIVAEGVASVMTAYNSLNGEWCGQNRALLEGILRDEWGFEGIVVSDFQYGLRDAALSVEAGLDVEMPFVMIRAQRLPGVLERGELSIGAVDRIVERVLAVQLHFARTLAAPADPSTVACRAHRALAREAAVRSMVLLRNEGPVLPLDRVRLRRVAVVGRLADVPNLGDGGSSNVHPPEVVTPLGGLRAALPGVAIDVDDGADPARAAEVARGADVAVVVVGYTHHDEGEYIDPRGMAHLMPLYPPMTDPSTGERLAAALRKSAEGRGMAPGGDRRRLQLSEGDESLLRAVSAANPRTVAVVMGGSAILMEGWRDRVPAILLAWYPGMEGGHALADVLLGTAEPGGRLPFVIPTRADHLPDFDPDAEAVVYDLWHGQWKLDRDGHAAAFPFGFGLGYARTSIEDVRLEVRDDRHVVLCRVRNRGDRAGAEVVQVYAGRPDSAWERPASRLVGFARVEVAAGATREVALPVEWSAVDVRDGSRWLREPGLWQLRVARHAGDPAAVIVPVEVPATD